MKIKGVINQDDERVTGTWLFYCEGCKSHHQIWDKTSNANAKWDFNGDVNKPSFSPSIKVQYTDYKKDENDNIIKDSIKEIICHSWITDGMIKYFDDSTHDLAGKTIELPNLE